MGYYINPQHESKEAFLNREGESTTRPSSYEAIPDDKAAVCLVNNGTFTAAGIVFRQRELEDFSEPRDRRRKTWFLVDRTKLYDVSDITADEFARVGVPTNA